MIHPPLSETQRDDLGQLIVDHRWWADAHARQAQIQAETPGDAGRIAHHAAEAAKHTRWVETLLVVQERSA